MKFQSTEDEPIYVEPYDPNATHETLDTQHTTTHYSKNMLLAVFSIFEIIDDFADDPSFMTQSKCLHSL